MRDLAGRRAPVHLVCAGTEGAVTAEDVLAAGSDRPELQTRRSRHIAADDVALDSERILEPRTRSSRERLRTVLRDSRGGRNLVELGYDADIEFAARVDSIPLVAEYFPATGDIRPVR